MGRIPSRAGSSIVPGRAKKRFNHNHRFFNRERFPRYHLGARIASAAAAGVKPGANCEGIAGG
jgi:hypothetical protein